MGVLEEAESREEMRVGSDDRSAQDIGMTINVLLKGLVGDGRKKGGANLGDGVHDDVCPEEEGVLVVGRGESVVDDCNCGVKTWAGTWRKERTEGDSVRFRNP